MIINQKKMVENAHVFKLKWSNDIQLILGEVDSWRVYNNMSLESRRLSYSKLDPEIVYTRVLFYYLLLLGQRPLIVTLQAVDPKCGQIYCGKFKMSLPMNGHKHWVLPSSRYKKVLFDFYYRSR